MKPKAPSSTTSDGYSSAAVLHILSFLADGMPVSTMTLAIRAGSTSHPVASVLAFLDSCGLVRYVAGITPTVRITDAGRNLLQHPATYPRYREEFDARRRREEEERQYRLEESRQAARRWEQERQARREEEKKERRQKQAREMLRLQRRIKRIGTAGEDMTFCMLQEHHFDRQVAIYQNIAIRAKNRCRAEIDVLLFHPHGIFIIESKERHGAVVGNTEEDGWFTKGYRSPRTNFSNPLYQTRQQRQVLAALLQIEPQEIQVLIVFSDAARLRITGPLEPRTRVIKRGAMLPAIDRIIAERQVSRTDEELDALIQRLKSKIRYP